MGAHLIFFHNFHLIFMYNIDQPKPAMVFTAVRIKCDTKMAAVFSCMRPLMECRPTVVGHVCHEDKEWVVGDGLKQLSTTDTLF